MGLLNDFIEGKVCAVVQNVEDQYRLITYLRGIIPECVSNWDSWLARYEDSPDKAGFSGFIHMGMRIGDHFVYQYSDGQSYQEERGLSFWISSKRSTERNRSRWMILFVSSNNAFGR